MALKPCHECGHNVSSEATKCPHCGVQLKEDLLSLLSNQRFQKGTKISWELRVFLALGLLLIILYLNGYLR